MSQSEVDDESRRLYLCDICDKYFSTSYNLKRHVHEIHDDNDSSDMETNASDSHNDSVTSDRSEESSDEESNTSSSYTPEDNSAFAEFIVQIVSHPKYLTRANIVYEKLVKDEPNISYKEAKERVYKSLLPYARMSLQTKIEQFILLSSKLKNNFLYNSILKTSKKNQQEGMKLEAAVKSSVSHWKYSINDLFMKAITDENDDDDHSEESDLENDGDDMDDDDDHPEESDLENDEDDEDYPEESYLESDDEESR